MPHRMAASNAPQISKVCLHQNTDVWTRTIHDFWMLKSWFIKIYFDAPQNDDFVNAGITEKSTPPKFFNNF